jgi:hypothetical protein
MRPVGARVLITSRRSVALDGGPVPPRWREHVQVTSWQIGSANLDVDMATRAESVVLPSRPTLSEPASRRDRRAARRLAAGRRAGRHFFDQTHKPPDEYLDLLGTRVEDLLDKGGCPACFSRVVREPLHGEFGTTSV